MKPISEKVGNLTIREQIRSGRVTGKWQVDITPKYSECGKRERITACNRDEAIRLARKIQFGGGKAEQYSEGISFDEFLSIWFEKQQVRTRLKKKKVSSLEEDLTYLKSVQSFFESFALAAIGENDLEAYQAQRANSGIRPTTINSEVRTLKAILNLAVKEGYLTSCPTVEPIPERNIRVDLPTLEELHLIISHLPFQQQIMARMMFESGCRPGEVYNLPWAAVSLGDRPKFYIDNQEEWSPKEEVSVREVPLSQELANDLGKLEQTSKWVFPSPNGSKPVSHFRKSLDTACRKANIHRAGKLIRVTPKMFRKCYASYQSDNGLDPALIQSMMGHAPGSVVTDKHYKIFSDSTRRAAIIPSNPVSEIDEVLPFVAKKVATQPYQVNMSEVLIGLNPLIYMEEFGAGDESRTNAS